MNPVQTFPINLFTSQRRFNDYGAPDMKFGDISESSLRKKFNLTQISNIADPYNLLRLSPFDNPQSRFFSVYPETSKNKLSVKECADLLFEELRATSIPYALYGQYRPLINLMITHMQENRGKPFNHSQLHIAYKNQILNDSSRSNSLNVIKRVLNKHARNFDTNHVNTLIREITENISNSVLPKFDAFADRFNGMGITIHDIHATKIDLLSFEIKNNSWFAKIKYTAQDHFGLDESDIKNKNFNQLQFFKAWFVLQHYDRFGFRPFMTNMEATISLAGETL